MQKCHRFDRIIERKTNVGDWLDKAAPFTSVEQSHLDVGTAAQAYWHHGYHAAMDDVLEILKGVAPVSESCPCENPLKN